MKPIQRGKLKYNVDLPLIITTAVLIIIGIIFIYSAGSNIEDSKQIKPYMKQIIFFGVGILTFIIIVFFLNYKRLSSYAFLFYGIAIVLLSLVIFTGVNIHGSTSWFTIAGLSFQPSEITKIFLIILLAQHISREKQSIQKISSLLITLALPIPIIALILSQPDPGTALVYIPITIAMLLVGGANVKHIIILISVGTIALILSILPNYYISINYNNIQHNRISNLTNNTSFYSFAFTKDNIKELKEISASFKEKNARTLRKIFYAKIKFVKEIFIRFTLEISFLFAVITAIVFLTHKFILKKRQLYYLSIFFLAISIGIGASASGQLVVKPHHTTRILTFLDLKRDPKGSSYHQRQSIIAIGSGGIFGHGLTKGPQNKFNFIPEKTTDFIFAIIGEEWGFFRGSLLIILLYFIIMYRLLNTAYNAKDRFGTLVAVGISAMLATHIIFNIAMCIGVWPVMGIPLPFLSAGGSSLITNIIAIGLVANISKKRFTY